MVAIEGDRRGFNDVGFLPHASVTGVFGFAGPAFGRHAAGSDVDRRGRRKERALGIRLQVAVGALDVILGFGIARDAVQQDSVSGGRHAGIDHAGRSGQVKDLGLWIVGRFVGISRALTGLLRLVVLEGALLNHVGDAAVGL